MDKLNVAQSGLSLLSLQVLLLPCGTENKQNKEKVMQAMLKHYRINNKKLINISIKPFWIPSSIKLNAFHYFVFMNSTCSISKLKTAFCKYRTPPWINLVLLLLVPEEKSNFSTKPVFNPTKQFLNVLKRHIQKQHYKHHTNINPNQRPEFGYSEPCKDDINLSFNMHYK